MSFGRRIGCCERSKYQTPAKLRPIPTRARQETGIQTNPALTGKENRTKTRPAASWFTMGVSVFVWTMGCVSDDGCLSVI